MSADNGPDVQPAPEAEAIPSTLWRGFTVLPEELSPELFTKPLVPGTQAEDDPTKIADGNERGVYMSSNSSVAEIYSIGGDRTKRTSIRTGQRFNNGFGPTTDTITLPSIGVVLKVDTSNLSIRKPQILPVWMGHYNNGFQGDEWIADEIPATAYTVSEIVVAEHQNDVNKVKVKIENPNDPEEIQKAIEAVQGEYATKKQSAQEFADLINGLSPQEALNPFIIKRKWQEHLKQKASQQSA